MTKSLLYPTSPSSLLSSSVNVVCTLFFLFFFQSEIVVALAASASLSSAPVIGIVTQPWSNKEEGSYIAASYVKWLEAGGARSIAIPYDASNELVEDIFTQIDGILLTGGDNADISPALYHLWDLLLSSYDNDDEQHNHDLIPLWGTCLGFQYLIQLGSESKHASFPPRPLFDAYTGVSDGISLPLEQVKQYHLYQNEDIYHAVQTQNITVNSHSLGITPQQFLEDDFLSHNYWKITSINEGDEVNHQKHPFVSTIEPIHPDIFPVYGVQFHPEKNTFEYGEVNVDHSKLGIDVSLYMSSFFIDLVRQNIINRENNGNGTGNGNGNGNGNGKYTKPDTYPLLYTYPIEHIGGYFEQKILIPPATPATTTVEDDTVNFEAETVGVVRSAHNINNNNNIISSSSDNDILSSMPPATTRTTTIASMLVGGMTMMVVVVVGSIVFMKQKPKCSYDSKKNRYENISNEGKDEQQ